MKIDRDVMAVLERAAVVDGGIKLVDQLERPMYVRVNKVLECTGWKWDRKRGVHVHPSAIAADDALESMLASGEVVDAKSELGFFETTGQALDKLMGEARVFPSCILLEPSAGSGNIVRRCKGAHVTAVEIDSSHADGLRAMRADMPSMTLLCPQDFLEVQMVATFDRVVMNPPFAGQLDLQHVLHAMAFLRPGGRLAAIMASGVMFRTNRRTQAFHEAIASWRPVWTPLPEGSFKASGTDVNTVLLTLDRPA